MQMKKVSAEKNIVEIQSTNWFFIPELISVLEEISR